jgi:acetyl-CoA/propionyl-CoA carboxylase biotin carboxyl carrier protein
VTAGSEISGLYDPMVAKLIVRGSDREAARRRMLRALGEYEIGGVKTLLGFHQALLSHPCFVEGETCHGLVESELLAEQAEQFSHRATTLTGASDGSLSSQATRLRTTVAEVDGRRIEVKVLVPEPPYRELARRRRDRAAAGGGGAGSDAVVSPMQGTVLQVKISEGDAVAVGDVICIVEAMKMENEVTAHRAGTVVDVAVAPGQPVTAGQTICVLVSAGV